MIINNIVYFYFNVDFFIHYGKIIGILFVLSMWIFLANRFIYKNRYKLFCTEEYFENTRFRNEDIGTSLCWLYGVLPLLLVFVSIVMYKAIHHTL